MIKVPENSTNNYKLSLYNAQKSILSSGKNTDSILDILSKTATEILECGDIAVIFYDVSSQTSRVRFNDGFVTEVTEALCSAFTEFKLSKQTDISKIACPSKKKCKIYPISNETEIFGILALADQSVESEIIDEFTELAVKSISTFGEVELVKLQMEEMSALLDVGRVVSSTLDLKELLTKIMSTATEVMRCETSTVYLIDEITNELYFHIVQGDPNVGAKLQEIRLPMGTGLAGWCAQESKPVIVPDTEKDPRFFKDADKKSGFITRSMICVPMVLKEKTIGVLQVLNRTGDIPFNDHDVEMLGNVANQAVSAIENARLYENIQKVYLSTIEVLATAIDAKDPYTQGHSRRVTLYSVAIAEELNMTSKQIENVRYSGLLHDVGKIGIKDSIIKKPGRLTDEEYGIIKQHPSIGAKILKPVDFLSDKIPGVLHHHEYYDGRGYPSHLTGDNIPLDGRIICVADAFDAMTTNRPYRKGLSVKTAVGELNKFSGKQFDPECVKAFLRAFDKKLFQYFEKVEGTDDMVLKDDESETDNPFEAKPDGKTDSQPFPPINAIEGKAEEKPSSQPFPPINTNDEKPSSQPFPPINTDDD